MKNEKKEVYKVNIFCRIIGRIVIAIVLVILAIWIAHILYSVPLGKDYVLLAITAPLFLALATFFTLFADYWIHIMILIPIIVVLLIMGMNSLIHNKRVRRQDRSDYDHTYGLNKKEMEAVEKYENAKKAEEERERKEQERIKRESWL